jgi:acetoin utilization deacetylase AcuC-like enzyme
MKVVVTDRFALPLPTGHRFPAEKYALLRRRVEGSGLFRPEDFVEPDAVSEADLLRAHTADYVERIFSGRLTRDEQNRIGFPWSPGMVERSRRSTGGTLLASRFALAEGVAVNLAGGTHHAFADWGEGFCVFNDSVVASRALQAEGLVTRVVVIDCDVHQGNGTAALTWDDPNIFTFSIHAAKNYPQEKAFSDLDVELPDGTGDEDYLRALEAGLAEALSRADADLAIYLAGADPFSGDRLGRLALTKDGLARRDESVFAACAERRLPVAVTMAGGYGRDIQDTIDIHARTVAIAESWARRWG